MAEMKHFSQGIYEEGVSSTTLTPSIEVGARRYYKGEEYVYCYNAGGASISQGLGVKFVTGASGYSVAASNLTDVFNPLVGVTKNVAMAAAEYGWVMTRGFATVTIVSAFSAGPDFIMLALGAAGKFIEASGTSEIATAAVVGYALGTPAPDAGGTAYAFIRGHA